jgi:hypothetical protein
MTKIMLCKESSQILHDSNLPDMLYYFKPSRDIDPFAQTRAQGWISHSFLSSLFFLYDL